MLWKVAIVNRMVVEGKWRLTHRILRTCDLRSSFSDDLCAPYLKDEGNAVSMTAYGTWSNIGEPENMTRHIKSLSITRHYHIQMDRYLDMPKSCKDS